MTRRWGPRTPDFLLDSIHLNHGVDLRLRTSVAALDGLDVVLTDGHRITPDVIVVGIGAIPDTRLAARAGLVTDDGVLVTWLRSSR